MADSRVHLAERLMSDFAMRAGLGGGESTRRYLWTDAFAVTALLGLHRHTQKDSYLDWALRLIDLVHHVLGRHRPDESRTGWISGLSDSEGERRPTAGGLRIGKPLPERGLSESNDEQLEWDRDGQYFHYLTKWMLALTRVSVITGDARFNLQAVDLAHAAHRAFVYQAFPGGPRRMYWKMSIDLTRPLVTSMGQLDPLDGLATFSQLQATQRRLGQDAPPLDEALADMRRMCEHITAWATVDPLSLGGLLVETANLFQLIASRDVEYDELPGRLMNASRRSLEAIMANGSLDGPPRSRLAFRELGLSLGLRAVVPMRASLERCPDRFGGGHDVSSLRSGIESIARHIPISDHIEQCWLTPAFQQSPTWAGHLDINSVMLATSLVPEVHLLANPSHRSQSA